MSEEIIEETGEVIETEPKPAGLARVPTTRDLGVALERDAGTRMLALLTDDQFEARIALLSKERDRLEQLFKRGILREGIDYGTFDFGKKKPDDKDKKPDHSRRSLYQSGAEQVCRILGLVAVFPAALRLREYGDGVSGPPIRVTTTCRIHLGSADGPCIGEGTGEANTWEVKYRYRNAKPECPTCRFELRRSNKPDEPPFYCWAKIGGCGWKGDVDTSGLGKVENPDPHEQANTIVKQSAKRAHVDAVKRTVGLSWLTSQDLEDLRDFVPTEEVDKTKPRPRVADEGAPAREERAKERDAKLSGDKKPASTGTPPQIPPAPKCPNCSRALRKSKFAPGWWCPPDSGCGEKLSKTWTPGGESAGEDAATGVDDDVPPPEDDDIPFVWLLFPLTGLLPLLHHICA